MICHKCAYVYCRDAANLRHLVSIRPDSGRDAEQHLDMLPHFFWDLVQQSWTHAAQLQM